MSNWYKHNLKQENLTKISYKISCNVKSLLGNKDDSDSDSNSDMSSCRSASENVFRVDFRSP